MLILKGLLQCFSLLILKSAFFFFPFFSNLSEQLSSESYKFSVDD